ncbi:MAG: hypothetical protein MUP09_00890 [Thiovulaceae bacterium]|nr:hypothetical protein [Sulfurimonadaceae bacterium]
MSQLIKCNGCKEEISINAKRCPCCGKKASVKTPLRTWLLVMLFLMAIYNIGEIHAGLTGTLSVSAPQ